MKKKTVRQLVKKLDQLFSIFVRKSAADSNGFAKCFTCGSSKPWQELQCGHFCSRRHMNTRFEIKNTAPQCVACNIFKHGALDVYALNLQLKYGDGILKELNQLKNQVKRWTTKELEELIEKYK